MALRPGSCRTTCGSWSSRSCRRRSGAFAIRAVGGCPNGRRCTGSCSCCTPGSRGRTCRASWASVRGVAEGRVWVELHEVLLTRLRAAGEIEWSRAVVDSSHVQAKKGVPRPGRARWTEAAQAPSTISLSMRQASHSRGRSPVATPTTSPSDPARRRGAGGTRHSWPSAQTP